MIESSALLSWYDAAKRDLPWRVDRDPYRIWLSEVMLQQTRVGTALPYYERFVERFPDVGALAAAEVGEVLALWSGLGYYRRARQLHAAARQIAASGGRLPRTVAGLLKLPGIGPYTAAAVASIAFGVAAPALDGNAERVLSRLLALESDPRRGAGKRALLEAAKDLLDPDSPGDSNQALMELGATLCTPRSPRCGDCPLTVECQARELGDPERFPRRPARKRPRRLRLVGVVARRGSRILLFRRPEDSELLAGIWEIPWAPAGDGAVPEERLGQSYGGSWRLGESAGKVRHAITHRALEIDVVFGVVSEGETMAEGVEAGWFTPRQIRSLASSSLVGKILRRAGVW